MSEIKFDEAQIGGVKLHYATAGTGSKLIVLLHGFPEFWYSWRHQLKGLSDQYTVVAPDLRGYNLSDKPTAVADYEIDKLIDDVIGLIRHFGREQAAVVGHDWGASIAWAVAQKHPEAVWKLCAMQIPPIAVWRKNQTLKQFLASWYMFFFQIPALPEWLLSRGDYALLENSLKNGPVAKDVLTAADIAEYKKAWSEPGAITGALNYYRANLWSRILNPPAPEEKIKVPTRFIYGQQDKFVMPETIAGISQFIDAPFSEIKIPDAGHWVQQEAPDVVNDSLREFFAEN